LILLPKNNSKMDSDLTTAISTKEVSFSYDGFPVLDQVDIEIPQGDFVSVVGPNGGGKTTLLRLILGLVRPNRGTVRVFGEPPEYSRGRIGYLPQHTKFDPTFPVSVMDVVLMGRLGQTKALGPFSKKDRQIAQSKLEEAGIYQLRNKAFASLSGGQRQRVLIARALASDPEILLLDEPTSHLDRLVEGHFYELLRKLNDRLTIVMVSHDLGFVSQFVKTVLCVKNHVYMHPTSEITGEIINAIYGSPMRIVRHDRGSSEEKPVCFSS
jgi:zinc transport system ATP-binding protein